MDEECWYQDTDEEEDSKDPVDLWFSSFVRAYGITTCATSFGRLPDYKMD